MSTSLAVVTGDRAPDLSEDGRALADALRERGLAVEPASWNDPGVEWTDYDAALFRSCWDYHADPQRFRSLLETLESGDLDVLNPLPAVRWNLHKFYLRDLLEAGVPVLPTEFLARGSETELAALVERRGWDDVVVKPAIGTSSEGVWRTTLEDALDDQDRFEKALQAGDVLVQQFAPEVRDGERSLVFFAGEFAYAKNVRPADGEFRTHPNFGGTAELHDPPEGVIEDAREALLAGARAAGVDPRELPYARVDGVVRGDRFRLMELELIEPYLGLRTAGALEEFADVVARALRQGVTVDR